MTALVAKSLFDCHCTRKRFYGLSRLLPPKLMVMMTLNSLFRLRLLRPSLPELVPVPAPVEEIIAHHRGRLQIKRLGGIGFDDAGNLTVNVVWESLGDMSFLGRFSHHQC
jgi:hypothetical protein